MRPPTDIPTPPTPLADIASRWSTIAAMSPEDFARVAARVSVCVFCGGPALLIDEELATVVATPLCSRCRWQEVAA